MKPTVAVGLRPGPNQTNFRAEAVAAGLKAAGCKTIEIQRSHGLPREADLYVQTGMGATVPLNEAIEREIPFIIAEAPLLRKYKEITVEDWVAWAYGGLCGGGWTPKPPDMELWKPKLLPKQPINDDLFVVCGQKANDHSLRDSNHLDWCDTALTINPEAIFRPSPLMYSGYIEPVDELFAKNPTLVTYTSTIGTEGLYEGLHVECGHYGAMAYGVTNREEWAHELSYRHFPADLMATRLIGEYILSGFERAQDRARKGLQEVPRPRMQKVVTYNPLSMKRIP